MKKRMHAGPLSGASVRFAHPNTFPDFCDVLFWDEGMWTSASLLVLCNKECDSCASIRFELASISADLNNAPPHSSSTLQLTSEFGSR